MKTIYKVMMLCLFGLMANTAIAQITVTGTVLDDLNEGLPGASISIKGTNTGTITDLDGKFSIQAPNAKSVLVISFVGYKTQEITVGDKRNIKISMKDDSKVMDEVVVVGYANQKKVNLTGAVASLDDKALKSRPISNAVQGLQGAVPGLNISNDNGGALGQSMDINIRGVGTIDEGSSSAPLILIDGMEGELSSINPNDIENISVLKDAAAASIYGSRAPFGVILITTKSGERGTQLSYTGNVRISQPIAVPNPVDSYTYALMINDAYRNSGGSDQFSASALSKILKYQRGELPYGIEQAEGQNDWAWNQRSFGNTNWYDTYLKKATVSQEHNVSLSGGGDKIIYYFSANYLGQNGLFNYADEKYDRLTINGKVNVKITDHINLNWNTRLVATENDKPTAMNDLFFHNLGRRSPLSPVYMPNGEYNQESLIPAMKDGGRQNDKNQLIYNQAQFTYEPIKNWKLYLDVGSRIEAPRYTRQFNKMTYTLPDGTKKDLAVLEGVADKSSVDPTTGSFRRQPPAGTNYYEKANGRVNFFTTNVRTDYELKRNDHYFKVLVGMQTEYYYDETTRVSSDDILLDETPFFSSSGTNVMLSDKKGEWATVGIFGRLNYSYADRYMVEVNLRGDGASRFPSDQRWAIFPSFSAGWNIAQEPFWTPLAEKGFDMFKIRASYGKLGNQNTTSFYPYFQKMYTDLGTVVLGDEQAMLLYAPEPYSTKLTWEKIENAGVGVDISAFSNRLSASFDWYQRTTKDMVGPSKALPSIFGAEAPKTNNAELRTRGWEFQISWRDRVNKDFSYGITGTLSDYESIITKYDSPDGNLDKYYSGKKLGDIWGYEVEGIAKSDAEMDAWLAKQSQSSLGTNWGGGDFMYRDLDHSGSVDNGGNSVTDHGDLKVIGNGTPRFAFGLTLDAKWKFIDIRAFFQGIGKRDVFFQGSATFFGIASEWQRSLYTDHLDYFRYAGSELGANYENPYYARLRTDGNNRQVCDYYLQNAAYVRLKNLQIGFSLPENTKLSRIFKKARLYVSGENLFTITGLRIYDPEAIGSSISEYGPGKTYPMYRVWSAGLELTF